MNSSRWLWTIYTDAQGVRTLAGFANTGNGWWYIDGSRVPVDSDKFRRFATGDFDFGRILHATGQPVRLTDLGTNGLPDDIETVWADAKPWTPEPEPAREISRARWLRPANIDDAINAWQAA